MPVRIVDLSRLYKFPQGRIEFALREVERRARAKNQLAIANLAHLGMNEAQAGLALMVRFKPSGGAQYLPEATTWDKEVDNDLSAFANYLDVQIRAHKGQPRALAAARVKEALIPKGVIALSGLPYPEEHAAVNNLLLMAKDPEVAVDVNLLPEGNELLSFLRRDNDQYGEVLNQSNVTPEHADVVEAKAQAQETLVATLSLIIGTYAQHRPIDIAERDYLLEPILKQQEALRLMYRRRRVIVDVDPQTGEDLEPSSDEPPPVIIDDDDDTDPTG